MVSTAGDRRYCNEHSIVVQAYCPLVKADPKKLNDPVISQIAKKYNKEGAQVRPALTSCGLKLTIAS